MSDEDYAAHEAAAAEAYAEALEAYRADRSQEGRDAERDAAASLQAVRKARRDARESAAENEEA